MDFFESLQHFYHTYVTLKNIEDILHHYRGMGMFLGILLPLLEAFIPILPLILFVVANAAAYGFILGFLLSWIGTCSGSFIVFIFCRKVVQRPLRRWIDKKKKLRSMLMWVERGGFGPVFLVLSIPFTPSSVINVVCGLSNMNARLFYLAVLLGKMVMIGIVTFIGTDWQTLIAKPTRMIIVLVFIVALWIIGKVVEKRMNTVEQVKEDNESKDVN
ncbi:putative membrane protein YdjX (TVP38/TMEM64 family) [Scopulibacillus darangshiensis]|uniref:TVP38/TMEM64 family membrane protein n=1 Tax=Scopulibacillus darangshiensis TaxID=442528 RepID=A0A4V2SN53_9BACL|nr:TVP38/TMEM64 family protein [Scopulibacillus darangshiensis]TCP29816.1 putative membrane protein YdjX (TVP38/TMEM64 family) [Scopulibacillus darangshiensis]